MRRVLSAFFGKKSGQLRVNVDNLAMVGGGRIPCIVEGEVLAVILSPGIWASFPPWDHQHRSWMYRLISTAARGSGCVGEEA